MSTFATTNIEIRFVRFDYLGDGLANVTASFDGREFTFATNENDIFAEPSRPEYDRFIEEVVTNGGDFDDDDNQNTVAAEEISARGIDLATAYADVCWSKLAEKQ